MEDQPQEGISLNELMANVVYTIHLTIPTQRAVEYWELVKSPIPNKTISEMPGDSLASVLSIILVEAHRDEEFITYETWYGDGLVGSYFMSQVDKIKISQYIDFIVGWIFINQSTMEIGGRPRIVRNHILSSVLRMNDLQLTWTPGLKSPSEPISHSKPILPDKETTDVPPPISGTLLQDIEGILGGPDSPTDQ